MSSSEHPSDSSHDRPRHRRIRQEHGDAVGRILGINHLVLFTRDMNEGVRFYRDILGMRVVRTQRFVTTGKGLRTSAKHSSGSAVSEAEAPSAVAVEIEVRQVFFEMGNGELFSLYQAPTVAERPDAPVSSVLWPEASKAAMGQPLVPQKLDHLSFDVASFDDIVWFRDHLRSHNIPVSEISERRGPNNTHRFISSIYFSDPSGNPLEISSFNAGDPLWQQYDFNDWFMDDAPVSELLESDHVASPQLVPRWVPQRRS